MGSVKKKVLKAKVIGKKTVLARKWPSPATDNAEIVEGNRLQMSVEVDGRRITNAVLLPVEKIDLELARERYPEKFVECKAGLDKLH